jgi:hypothetical protein
MASDPDDSLVGFSVEIKGHCVQLFSWRFITRVNFSVVNVYFIVFSIALSD